MYGGQLRSAMPSRFARPQEPDDVSIHEDDVLEIQHEGPARRFRSEQRGQFADVVGFEATAHGQDDVAICRALDFQHRSSARRREQSRGQRKMLNLNDVGRIVDWPRFRQW